MLSLTQYLIFELGTECNLGNLHDRCPNSLGLERYAGLDTSRPLNDATILTSVITAYKLFGFIGLVGWHYYNEPTLQKDRMFALMDALVAVEPRSRFVLWTNGTGKLTPAEKKLFSQMVQTPYSMNHADNLRLDDRLSRRPASTGPCRRVWVEFILDAFGNHHPCCYDWRGDASLGNVYDVGFYELAHRWRRLQDDVDTEEACKVCGFRGGPLPVLVPEIADRIKKHLTQKTNLI